MRRRLVLVVALAAAPVAALAQGIPPLGPEFRVNDYTPGHQRVAGERSVASLPSGEFVVVWAGAGPGVLAGEVFARRYDGRGVALGGEIPVDSLGSTATQVEARVVAAGGGFVVTWQGPDPAASGDEIFARRYDRDGVPRGPRFRVNEFTAGAQVRPVAAAGRDGSFVVAWSSDGQDGSGWGVFARRFDAAGDPRGGDFRVNAYTTGFQFGSSVDADEAGNFVVAWRNGDTSIVARRFDRDGNALGVEIGEAASMLSGFWTPAVAVARDGGFVIAWQSLLADGDGYGIYSRRYAADGTPQTGYVVANGATAGNQYEPSVEASDGGEYLVTWTESIPFSGSQWVYGRRLHAVGGPGVGFQVGGAMLSACSAGLDRAGNVLATWNSLSQDGDLSGVYARRFGGLLATALAVDATPGQASDGNGVLEPGEIAVAAPTWRNVTGVFQHVDGLVTSFTGPAGTAVGYTVVDGTASYGVVAAGAPASCLAASDCYGVGAAAPIGRPAVHWDASLTESLASAQFERQVKSWAVHVGETFVDVPRASPFYRFVETLLHAGVTAGCQAGGVYCPAAAATREQMAVFVLAAKEGIGYLPPVCGATPQFGDVPASSPYCRWVEELARRGVVGGCGGGNYCPLEPVTREQMPVFVLRTLDPALNPPPCAAAPYGDVPAASPFCRWILELTNRGVVSGCGGGNYCPGNLVTREQMSVFLTVTFGLTLYGP